MGRGGKGRWAVPGAQDHQIRVGMVKDGAVDLHGMGFNVVVAERGGVGGHMIEVDIWVRERER